MAEVHVRRFRCVSLDPADHRGGRGRPCGPWVRPIARGCALWPSGYGCAARSCPSLVGVLMPRSGDGKGQRDAPLPPGGPARGQPARGCPARPARFPCDGTAPAGPVVRRPGKRLWWIRAPWSIWCIPVPHVKSENVRPARRLTIESDGSTLIPVTRSLVLPLPRHAARTPAILQGGW